LLNVVNVHFSGDQEHVRAHVDHVVHVLEVVAHVKVVNVVC
jgi:hypothetical protein